MTGVRQSPKRYVAYRVQSSGIKGTGRYRQIKGFGPRLAGQTQAACETCGGAVWVREENVGTAQIVCWGCV